MENQPQEIINNYPRLKISDKFSFSCNKDLPCFNKCCADINIVLTPYDIIRLKNRLEISSEEFLNKYAVIPFNKQQKLPVVILKMADNQQKTCQFLGKKGCSVYQDRPWACRMYPIGFAAPENEKDENNEAFFFLMQEKGCEGLKVKREISIEEWMKDQGINEYDETGRLFKDITMHGFLLQGKDLDPKQMEMYYLVCYNIDMFRRFVFESTFLKSFEVNKELLEKVKKDDIELLKFGFNWLRFSLFKEKTMTVKTEVLEKKKRDLAGSKVK